MGYHTGSAAEDAYHERRDLERSKRRQRIWSQLMSGALLERIDPCEVATESVIRLAIAYLYPESNAATSFDCRDADAEFQALADRIQEEEES